MSMAIIDIDKILYTGFPAEPGSLEIAWNLSQKVRKPGQNKKFSRKPG